MEIYEGVWYDHGADKLILTLSLKAAGFLTAAIVIWVGFAATATWPIFRMLLWTFARNGAQTDAFHQQRQILLRNSGSAASMATSLVKLIREWGLRTLFPSLPHLLLSGFIFALWTTAGLFTPYIYTHSASQVLVLKSEYDGVPDVSFLDYVTNSLGFEIAQVERAQSYVTQCYGVNNTAHCRGYARPSLPFTARDSIDCPFARPELCVTVNSTILRMDTGLLDSNVDFGINAPKHDGIKYRRVATCSPIQTAPFVADLSVDDTMGYPSGTVLHNLYMGPVETRNGATQSMTFSYPNLRAEFPAPYTAEVRACCYLPSSNWVANTTLFNATDADVSIMGLESNGIMYLEPVYDPLFATKAYSVPFTDNVNVNITIYNASNLVSAIACTEQHQFCLPTQRKQCTALVSTGSIIDATEALGVDIATAQGAIIRMIVRLISDTYIFNAVSWKGASVLLASQTFDGRRQTAALPNDQWIKEVKHLFSIALAQLQGEIFAYATGSDGIDLHKWQLISDAHGRLNFDMGPLIAVIVAGAVLIASGFLFEKVFTYFALRNPQWRLFHERWRADGLYHLQMTKLEVSAGVDDWYNTHRDVPKPFQTNSEIASSRHDPTISLRRIPNDQDISNSVHTA